MMRPKSGKIRYFPGHQVHVGILCDSLFFGVKNLPGILWKKKMSQFEDDIPGRIKRSICTLNPQIGKLSQQVPWDEFFHGVVVVLISRIFFPEQLQLRKSDFST